MTKRIFGFWFVGIVLLIASGARAEDTENEVRSKGMLFPDLVVVRFFSSLIEHDIHAIERLLLDSDDIVLSVDGRSYKGKALMMGYVRDWLSRDKVDLFMRVNEIAVHAHSAEIGGNARGEQLSLETGLSRQVHYDVESDLRTCGNDDGHWCLFELTLLEKEL